MCRTVHEKELMQNNNETSLRECLPYFSGFNPSWNESFEFEVYMPDLALVRFVVEDHDSASDNEFVGQYTLPFNSLKMGEFSIWLQMFAILVRSCFFLLTVTQQC